MNPFLNVAHSVNTGPQKKAYAGGATGRLYSDWSLSNLSPDAEAKGVRPLLRARARQLVQDNAYAAGFVAEVQNNVVGPSGIKLRARVELASGNAHDKTNVAIEAAWADWCLPENASVDAHDSWQDIEKLVIRTIAVDGECFIRHRRYFNNDHGYALQLIDADQVDDYYNRLPSGNENEIRSGIEIDSDGRPVTYYVWKTHPSDGTRRERTPIPAKEIIHLFVRNRPGQTRGVTWFAPVLTSVKMHDGYTMAELVAARTGAAKMGFFVNRNPELGSDGFDPDANTGGEASAADGEDESGTIMEAAPGTFDVLPPGMELQTFDPQHPSTGFKDFTQVILRGIARGLGISYTALTGDLTAVNYSSIRAGLLNERDNWRALQRWLSTQLHRRVYRVWVSMAELTGALTVDARIAGNLNLVKWKPRGWDWVDPLKDIQARILGIGNGLDDRTSVLDDEGEDLEETFMNLKREQELAAQLGISITAPAPQKSASNQSDNQPDDNEDAPGEPNNRAAMRVA